MLDYLWLTPAIPFASALILAVFGSRLTRKTVAWLGAGSTGASAFLSILIAASFMTSPPPGNHFSQILWTWIETGGFRPEIAFYLDSLSVIFLLIVTFVAFLIHVYSTEFMKEDAGYSRFFAYMNLFVASMVTLVLADNLLLLYLGWEGVGLCSYLLIGFWYEDPVNGRAARKAFIVTRVGDTAMAIGLFLIFNNLHTLQIQELMKRASELWPAGSGLAVASAALLLAGAVGKSAQLPLQTWLPDAMAGPTPTSALIHAATMVTAGVYLIARTHIIFSLAPPVLYAVAVIGAITLLIAGFSALTQRDIKRVLAYSTISQIGYMFLALGVGAWQAAVFHFMTHAFFKALLFLAAGVVISALHHEHDMFKMGGLRKELPYAFWTFVIAGSSLAGLPIVTAGFYSKDLVIWEALSSTNGSGWLWAAGICGVLLTALYIYRLIFLTFYGKMTERPSKRPGYAIKISLVALAVLSIVGGLIETPDWLGGLHVFSSFLHTSLLPAGHVPAGVITEGVSEVASAVAYAAGLYLAYLFFLRRREYREALGSYAACRSLHRWWFAGWGFDWLYAKAFVQPVIWMARINRKDFVDGLYTAVAYLSERAHVVLSSTETGRVRWYAAGIAAGAVVLMGLVLVL